MTWVDEIEARTRRQAKYDKDHTIQVKLKLNLGTDIDVINWLRSQDSMQGAIKQLVRDEIERRNAK